MGLLSLCMPYEKATEEELSRLRARVAELEHENATLRADKTKLQQRLGTAVLGTSAPDLTTYSTTCHTVHALFSTLH